MPPSSLPHQLASLVLSHSDTTPKTLALTLGPHLPSLLSTPSLPSQTLKLLWNHGPAALLFFNALLHLPLPIPPQTLNLAIDIAARLRDRRHLFPLLSLLRRRRGQGHGHGHGDDIPLRTFSILAERYASAGKPDRAVRLFLSLPRPDLLHLNSLLDVLAKSRRAEKAHSLLRTLRHRFCADVVSYNTVADGYCRLKRTGKAMEVVREMVDAGIEPTLGSYNIVLKGFFRAGQVREGWEFFVQMRKRARKGKEGEKCCRPDVVTYTTVVHGLGMDGQIERARKVFDEMFGEGILPSVATYNALIQVICKKGSVEDAILVFEKMVEKGYTPNIITYNLVIRGLCHAGEMKRGMEFLERMRLEGCEPNVQTYTMLIRYWFEEGEIEKGLELFETMGREGGCLPNLDTYNVIISAMFVRKRPEDMLVAGKMVAEMVERGHMPRRFMFNRVLNGLLLTGNQGFAKELLRMQDKFGRLRREFKL